MNNKTYLRLVVLLSLLVLASISAAAQVTPTLKRTTFKTDKLDFGSGGTLSIIGAPSGSIRIEGWNRSEIEISAEIEVRADSEADLDQISKITGFLLEEGIGRTGIISTGTHHKKYLKTVAKKFPKQLIGLPFRIDYSIKVPRYCDLDVDGGKGDLAISGVEGMIKVNFLESDARIDLLGGGITATIGNGTADIMIPTRNWRGRFADVQLSKGTINVGFPAGLNAEVDGTILRTGKIENTFAELKPRSRKGEFTDKSVIAKSGIGGVALKFTVGDGNLNMFPAVKPG